MAVFRDPPFVVDGIDQTTRLIDASVAVAPEDIEGLTRTDTVVLHGPFGDAVALARKLTDLGPSVVVEVEVPRGSVVESAPFDDLASLGIAAGVHIVDRPGEEGPFPGDAGDDGWEIGAVTWFLANGVRTVRGVAHRRLSRIVAVADALAAAEEVPPSG
ncbi:MAG: hypothetical protein KDB02_01970 [Acidimicrobiales bacterium]|nr:hypothetical protein [Acidimicrobiales bacterium]